MGWTLKRTAETSIQHDIEAIRQWLELPVNIKEKGAIGDGIHDDTRPIQEAINQNAFVVFPKGDYVISKTIQVPANRYLIGEGVASIRSKLPSNAGMTDPRGKWLSLNGGNTVLENITFDGTGQPFSAADPSYRACIFFNASFAVPLRDVFLKSCNFLNLSYVGDGSANAVAHAMRGTGVQGLRILECRWDTITGSAVFLTDMTGVMIKDGYFDAVGYYNVHVQDSVQDLVVSDCIFGPSTQANFGGLIDCMGYDTNQICENFLIINNILKGEATYNYAIRMESVRKLVIARNLIKTVGNGSLIHVLSRSVAGVVNRAPQDITIDENILIANTSSPTLRAIQLQNDRTDEDMQNIVISRNIANSGTADGLPGGAVSHFGAFLSFGERDQNGKIIDVDVSQNIASFSGAVAGTPSRPISGISFLGTATGLNQNINIHHNILKGAIAGPGVNQIAIAVRHSTDHLKVNNNTIDNVYWAIENKGYAVIEFNSGSVEPSVGDTLTGAISGATGVFVGTLNPLTSGTWAGGDALGTLYVETVSGTFQAENIDNTTTATANIATITAYGAPASKIELGENTITNVSTAGGIDDLPTNDFANNDATPSVADWVSEWRTANGNSAPLLVTRLDGGVPGRTYTILNNDGANRTIFIDDGNNLRLRGNWTGNNGDKIVLLCTGGNNAQGYGKFQELYRSSDHIVFPDADQHPEKYLHVKRDYISVADLDLTNDWVKTDEQGANTVKIIDDADLPTYNPRGGVLALITAALNDDCVSLQFAGASGSGEMVQLVAGKQFYARFRVKMSEITQIAAFVGLSVRDTTLSSANDAYLLNSSDNIGFVITDAATTWAFQTAKNKVDDTVTGVTRRSAIANVSTDWVWLAFYYDGISSVQSYIDGAAAGTAILTTIPDDEPLCLTYLLKNGDAVSRSMLVDFDEIIQER